MSSGDQRAHPRREVVGKAFWSASRREGSCTLRNVSTGGALIERPDLLLTIGERLQLTIDLGAGEPLAIHATVLRMSNGAVAFRFERVTQAFLAALSKATGEADGG